MWECRSQDFRNWVAFSGHPKPPVVTQRFETKEAAEQAKTLARQTGLEACVVAMRIKHKRPPQAEDFNPARADWKLFP